MRKLYNKYNILIYVAFSIILIIIFKKQINNYAPFISAIATVVIAVYAIVNAQSLKISREMLNFEKEKEIKTKQPYIVFYEEPKRDAHGEKEGKEVYMKNIGSGPALNIHVQHGDDIGLSIDPLGPMERTMAYKGYSSDKPALSDKLYHAIAECEDIFGNLFRAEIEGGEPPKQRFCKVNERIITKISRF